jgi:hypothetical protein
VSIWFRCRSAAVGGLDEELAGWGRPLAVTDRACCCPAGPVVTAAMPPTAGRPYQVDLLLCGHHYRVSRAALQAAGATVYGETGAPVTAGIGDRQPARGAPAISVPGPR